ncbi:MAG: hypothetical protein DSO00_06150 [Archaeoglobi archaeon]|jgi:hypothetical protein|nr:MAG: hypothetical protein DSO00_06150 [Archaeoglobi archaeon]
MMWMLMAVLTVFAVPGDNVTVMISEPSLLETSDPCMFFLETMNSSAYLPEGSHTIKVGAACSPGVKFVEANGSRIAEITVLSEVKPEKLLEYAAWIEEELMKTHKELSSLKGEVENLTQKLNETISEKERIENDKRLLELELSGLRLNYSSLVIRYNLLSQELENKTGKIAEMESEIKSLSEQSTNYRVATFFLLSVFVGSFAAMVLMSRKT